MRRYNIFILVISFCNLAISQSKLTLYQEIKKILKAGTIDSYQISLHKNEFASIRVHQVSIGIGYAVYDPENKLIENGDFTAIYQDEIIQIASQKNGQYTIKIFWDYSTYHPVEGTYSIVLFKKEVLAKTPLSRIAQKFENWYSTSEPGAALAIIENGKVLYSHAKGLSTMEHQIKFKLNTPIELASCSKQFTGYAVALLLRDKKIMLDDAVVKYIPEVTGLDTNMRIKHLLAHTSGLRNWDEVAYIAGNRFDDIIDKSLLLHQLSTQTQLNFEPGERFEYSNTGYFLLSQIVEKVSGMRFGAFCKKNIFNPIGMNNTFVKEKNDQLIPNAAASYKQDTDHTFKAIANNLSAPGSTSTYSSVHDLVKWVNHLEYQINPDLKKLLLTRFTTNKGDTIQFHTFGNFYEDYKGHSRIEHLGLTLGYRTAMARFPKERKAIIYVANDGLDATYNRYYQLCDEILNIEPQLVNPIEFPDLTSFLTETKINLNPIVPEESSKFSGIYFCKELNTVYEIKYQDNKLILQHQRLEPIYLKQKSEDIFETTSVTRKYSLHFQNSGFYLASGNLKEFRFEKLEK